jgi:hypothetical protein
MILIPLLIGLVARLVRRMRRRSPAQVTPAADAGQL